MAPQMKLSGFSKVIVTARISKSGNAAPQSGDLEGASAPVRPGASGVASPSIRWCHDGRALDAGVGAAGFAAAWV